MRITVAVAVVLRVFLSDPAEKRYGYELMKQTGLGSSKLYPILDRLENAGWLTRHREDIDPAAAGRPVRVYYQLTADGQQTARVELAALTAQVLPRTSGVRQWAPGWGLR